MKRIATILTVELRRRSAGGDLVGEAQGTEYWDVPEGESVNKSDLLSRHLGLMVNDPKIKSQGFTRAHIKILDFKIV